MMALAMALVGETVPKARTGSAMGLLGTMSAVGTALGPSLGGVLIAGLGWRAIFLVNVPLGVVALRARASPPARRSPRHAAGRRGFDRVGTLLLALTLAAYALAMTIGRGSFGPLNAALLLARPAAPACSCSPRARAASPLIRLAMLRDPALTRGPRDERARLDRDDGDAGGRPVLPVARRSGSTRRAVGLVLSVGPLVAALTGVPAGRIVDRFGAPRHDLVGLVGMAAGSLAARAAAGGVGRRRLRRADRRDHRRLRAVPGGQQHRGDGGRRRRAARRRRRACSTCRATSG